MAAVKRDADYIFYELTRSICPACRRVLDAQVVLRDGKVYLRKRCPEHGPFEALVYADADAYVRSARFNKPGTIPLQYSTDAALGCPHDCGLCPEHHQHACVGIIEVNSACNMSCPLCFANAGPGFSLTLGEVEGILDHLVETEGSPEIVQFSGGEPTIHPEILAMLRAAKVRPIRHVMINTNGKRIAHDDRFVAELAELRPSIYFQFDGFEPATYQALRAEPELLGEKLRALDRLAEAHCDVILAAVVERGVNEQEVGRIVEFALEHPAVRGISFQPAFHAGRFGAHDPMQRMTNPDVLRLIEAQTDEVFRVGDFVPVPCCFPTCNSVTYAHVADGKVTPLPRLLPVEDYLDLLANRAYLGPDLVREALQGLWSTSALPGSPPAVEQFAAACAACDLASPASLRDLGDHMFMIMLQDFMDPWTFNQKNVMKCCKEILLPDGKQIPFCAYNSVGYREQARSQLSARERARAEARRFGAPLPEAPLSFSFGAPLRYPAKMAGTS